MSTNTKNTKATTMPKATNNTKEESVMKSTTKRPAVYTKAQWDNDTFRVYNGLIKLVKGEVSIPQFVNHPTVKDLFAKAINITTPEARYTQTVNLLISMAKDRTSHGEKERHILPIATLRKFFNGEYAVKSALPVTYAAPKEPKKPEVKKTEKKATKPSKSAWDNHVERALKAANIDGETFQKVMDSLKNVA